MHYTFLLHSNIQKRLQKITRERKRERERGGDKHTHCVPPISHLISLRDKEELFAFKFRRIKKAFPKI